MVHESYSWNKLWKAILKPYRFYIFTAQLVNEWIAFDEFSVNSGPFSNQCCGDGAKERITLDSYWSFKTLSSIYYSGRFKSDFRRTRRNYWMVCQEKGFWMLLANQNSESYWAMRFHHQKNRLKRLGRFVISVDTIYYSLHIRKCSKYILYFQKWLPVISQQTENFTFFFINNQ